MSEAGPVKIGIVGSRRRNTDEDFKLVEEAFFKVFIPYITHIISGGCSRGADRFAPIIADKYKCSMFTYHPKFEIGIPYCYFERNKKIAYESDILIACVAPDRKGGTEHTIAMFLHHHPEGKLIIV